jgi:signal transduction histidine kinase
MLAHDIGLLHPPQPRRAVDKPRKLNPSIISFAQMALPRASGYKDYVLQLLWVFLAYFLAGRLGLAAPFTSGNVSPVWLPSGIALATVLSWGFSMWPAIIAGAFLVNFSTGIPPIAALGIAVGNTGSALVGALLLGRVRDFRPSLPRVRDVLAMVFLGGLAATWIAATLGTATLYWTGIQAWSNFTSAWRIWWLGDAMGVILIAPLLLTGPTFFRSEKWKERLALVLCTLIATALIFDDRLMGRVADDVLAFLIFPFVIWGALRFGQGGSSCVSVLIATIAVYETAAGRGPFVAHDSVHNAALLELFLAVSAVTGMLLAAAVREREQAEAALAREQQLLRERTSAEEALIRSEKFAATGRLAASIAHEINNPLASITNLVYLLDSSDLSAEARSYIKILAREVDRISRIAKQTLGFYRDTGRPVTIPVAGLLDDLVDIYQQRLQEKNIVLNKKYSSSAEIEAYRDEVHQVFANLLLNACDAVAHGGAIDLAIEDDADKVRVLVIDNGEGIKPENHDKVFQPFFSTKHEKGVGLGLWVSLGIIQKHGGNIAFSSVSSDGSRRRTTFTVTLPKRVPPNA